LIRPPDEIPIEDDFVKKALRQIFGLLIIEALMSEITVNRLPVPFQQQIHQGLIFVML
jgi:hypothetical protein